MRLPNPMAILDAALLSAGRHAGLLAGTAGIAVSAGALAWAAAGRSPIPCGAVTLEFCLCGIALAVQARGRANGQSATGDAAAACLAGAAFVLGAFGSAQCALAARVGAATAEHGAPAAATHAAIALAAGALLLGSARIRPRLIALPALAAAGIAFIAAIQHLYGNRSDDGIAAHLAIPTPGIAMVLALAVGSMAMTPDATLVRVLASRSLSGSMLRRLIPAAVLIPVALGWLRIAGERASLYGTEFGLTLMTTAVTALLAALIWTSARSIHCSEQRLEESAQEVSRLNAELEQQVQARTAQLRQANDDLVREIGARFQSECELRDERDFLAALTETVGALVVVLDPEGRIARFNRACEQTTGYTFAEVVGRPFWDLFLAPEEVGEVRRIFQRLRAGDFPSRHENHWLRRSGERRWIDWSNTCIVGPDGAVQYVIGTGIDITDKRAAEAGLRNLNADLERRVQARTAELDSINRELESFAYSVSHDLRAPLRAIDGFGQALEEDCGDRLIPAGAADLARVRAAAQHMGQLIDALLSLSRVTRSDVAWQLVDVGAIAADAFEDVRAEAPDRQVTFVPEAGLRAIADARLLRIALSNLIGNAWKFTARRADARIEVGRTGDGDGRAFFVRDNGVGFDMRYADKLFGAFQRLHAPGEFAGTGIGLATVQRAIHRLGGRVWAEGQSGEGATFYFTLPGPPAPAQEAA